MKLVELTNVRLGTNLDRISSKERNVKMGNVKVLTLQSFGKNGEFKGNCKDFSVKSDSSIEVVEAGDILVKQATPCTISIIDEESSGYVVGSQYVLIKKCDVEPRIIAMQLEHVIQKELKIAQTSIGMRLNINIIKEAEISTSEINNKLSRIYLELKKIEVLEEKLAKLEAMQMKYYYSKLGIRKEING